MRIKINLHKGLSNPHEDCAEELLKEEFEKFFVMKVGDFVAVGAKRLCRGIFLGIQDSTSTPFSDELDPHVILADPFCQSRPVKIPLYDIFFFEVISGVSHAIERMPS